MTLQADQVKDPEIIQWQAGKQMKAVKREASLEFSWFTLHLVREAATDYHRSFHGFRKDIPQINDGF